MSVRVKTVAAMVLVAMMTVVSGCAYTGMSENAEEAAMMDDIMTERKILRAIRSESQLQSANITVGCLDGVVTLNGLVESDIQKNLAERVAASVEGVTSVVNNLSTES